MPTDYVKELIRLAALTKPREQPKADDWRKVETELGYELPADFKTLVSGLGSGSFGSFVCGLTLQNPCASIKHTRLSRESLTRHREMMLDLEQALGIALYPSPGGMVLVASIDRQDFYFAPEHTSSKKLSNLVWLDVDLESIKPLNSTFSQFIHDLYLGLIAEPWAEEFRAYFWREGAPFFSSAPELDT